MRLRAEMALLGGCFAGQPLTDYSVVMGKRTSVRIGPHSRRWGPTVTPGKVADVTWRVH